MRKECGHYDDVLARATGAPYGGSTALTVDQALQREADRSPSTVLAFSHSRRGTLGHLFLANRVALSVFLARLHVYGVLVVIIPN
ncbi:MAG: hypothetical protein ACYDEV_03100 [Acidiferrobacter sp.]